MSNLSVSNLSTQERIERAILAHSQWKVRLKQAVKNGNTKLTLDEVRNPNRCDFGKWLYSHEGKFLLRYEKLIELHRKFHEEAYRVVYSTTCGCSADALKKMQIGSEFSKLTAQLVNMLVDIKESIES